LLPPVRDGDFAVSDEGSRDVIELFELLGGSVFD
jgi:hypothetical protein